jgi:hypothetical protein
LPQRNKPNSNLPALGKGKEISNLEPVEHYSAPQYNKKDKVPWSPTPPDRIKLNVDVGFDQDGQAINDASRPKKRNV